MSHLPTNEENAARRHLNNHHHLKDGFSEIKVTECSAERTDLVHHCYYGSSCIDAINEFGLLDRFCECSTADQLTAGLMCEFEATSICMTEDVDKKHVTDQFCVNKGECLSLAGAGEDHPGCSCEGVWEGHHCEFPHGVLLDDALDLFQQRKAEIINERDMDHDKLNSRTVKEGESEGSPVFLVAGACVAVLAVVNMFVFAVRKSRKNRLQQSVDNDYHSVGVGSTSEASRQARANKEINDMITSLAPPSDVFLASRKKEVESDDGSSFMMTPGHQTEICEGATTTGDVEMLDAETSRILEAQFKICEAMSDDDDDDEEEDHLLESSDEGSGNELLFALSYGSGGEDIDQHSALHSGRITINSGKNPLSKLRDETFSDVGMSGSVEDGETMTCENEESIGLDEILGEHGTNISNGVTSLDGESTDEDSDDGHYYV
mmetsp:Transcript_23236/g.43992  ORF Transcript_23236/g.43992 Transcript_23236/m.43992 type:complete len:435 (-) Transcript_23236:1037-2341(-)